MAESKPGERVIEIIDGERQELIDLCLRLGNARDYAGDEREVAEAVEAWLAQAGIETRLQRISETSVNAVGILRGTGDRSGGARSLILNAHMDTQGATPAAGAEEEQRLRGAREQGGLLYGNGLANDKAQLAAQMIVMRAIVRAGLRLGETLYVTGVAQETGAPPEHGDETEGWSGIGPRMSQVREGHGARWLVEHGIVADYALVGETTDFKLSLGAGRLHAAQDRGAWPFALHAPPDPWRHAGRQPEPVRTRGPCDPRPSSPGRKTTSEPTRSISERV